MAMICSNKEASAQTASRLRVAPFLASATAILRFQLTSGVVPLSIMDVFRHKVEGQG